MYAFFSATNQSDDGTLVIYKKDKLIYTSPRWITPLMFSPTEGALIVIPIPGYGSPPAVELWERFEETKPICLPQPQMEALHSESPKIIFSQKAFFTAPDGSLWFTTRDGELKQLDDSRIVKKVQWSKECPPELIVWNQKQECIGLYPSQLYKVQSGQVETFRLKKDCSSLTALTDNLVAVGSMVEGGIEIVNTQNNLKSVGFKPFEEKISTILTHPDTGELIVVFRNRIINSYAVDKKADDQIELIETNSYDTQLEFQTAEWNPYTHRLVVMNHKEFKEIELIPANRLHEALNDYLLKPLGNLTMEYLGFFPKPKATKFELQHTEPSNDLTNSK